MNLETLIEKCEIYKKHEGRASFYDLSLEIVEEHPLHASVIILATWNSGRFRFMISDSRNLQNLVTAIEKTRPLFEELKGYDIQNANYKVIGEIIKLIYSTFSKVKGVEYTGTSKVMHILQPKLIVMWDTHIRNEYGYTKAGAEEFLQFQEKMQSKFAGINWKNNEKTLAKAIDEYNYAVFTLPKILAQRKKK